MHAVQISFPAVGTAALATITLGALWYSSLLFGPLWMKAHGFTPEETQQMAARGFIVSLACYVVMAFVLATIASQAGVTTAVNGAFLGFLVWLGFLAMVGLTDHMFSRATWTGYLIDTGFKLVYAVLMGAIICAWR